MKRKLFLSSLFFMLIFLAARLAQTQQGLRETGPGDEGAVVESESGNVTLDFKDADIRNVLRILSYKGGVNIVAGKDVEGTVTIRLVDVPWEKALDVILKTYDYGYERDGNIVTVSPMGTFTQKKLAEKELAEVEPLVTEVFTLSYVDAEDAKAVLESQLSPRGKVTVFKKKVQKGWPFGAGGGSSGGATSGVGGFGVQERAQEIEPRASMLVVSDIASYMDRIKKVVLEIDKKPKQILIETRIVEVNTDSLKDLGFDWGTGSSAVTSADVFSTVPLKSRGKGDIFTFGGRSLGSEAAPSIFGPKAADITGTVPYNTGLTLAFQKLTGAQFQVLLHALQEDVQTNTLSAPRILTLDNQEAKILIGTSHPILKADITSSTTSTVISQTLDYYQNLGIVLNVIPQISADDYINMVIHPAVYSSTESITATSQISGGGSVSTSYPIVLMREADTQVLMKSGETVVIGGLLKDIKSEGMFSVPILGDIPFLGALFKRKTTDTEKIDLLIFLTARVIESVGEIETAYGVPVLVGKHADKAKSGQEKGASDMGEPLEPKPVRPLRLEE